MKRLILSYFEKPMFAPSGNLADHYHKSPDLISEEELRQYFLYIKNVKKYSRAHHLASPLDDRDLRDQVLTLSSRLTAEVISFYYCRDGGLVSFLFVH